MYERRDRFNGSRELPADARPDRYDARAIERRGRRLWEREGTWEVPNPGDPGFDPDVPESYVLEMLPYPSGEPHIGHLKNYSMGDALAHFRRRHGHAGAAPDGLRRLRPARREPRDQAPASTRRSRPTTSIAEFRRQFRAWGVSIDWRREFGDPRARATTAGPSGSS